MEHQIDYWRNRWENNDIPWHHPQVCPFLTEYASLLKQSTVPCTRIFVPLCGRSVDLKWLYEQGFHVVGLEASEKAVKEFFDENEIPVDVCGLSGNRRVFKTSDERLQIFCSDLFDTRPEELGKFDAVWDKGSLVALNVQDRQRYSCLMKAILKNDFSYLLSTIVYDETKFASHPRSVPVEEISKLFGDLASVTVLEELDRWNDRLDEKTVQMRWSLANWREIVLLLKRDNNRDKTSNN